MHRTTVIVTAVVVSLALGATAAPAKPVCRSQHAACVDRLIAEMQAHVDALGCRHDAVFALLYEARPRGSAPRCRARSATGHCGTG
jgi:hypothetical protein